MHQVSPALLVLTSSRPIPDPRVQGAAQAIGSHPILTVVLDRVAEKIGLPESYSYYGYQQPPRTFPRQREWFSWRRYRTAE